MTLYIYAWFLLSRHFHLNGNWMKIETNAMAVGVNLPCYGVNITVERVEKFIVANAPSCVTTVYPVLSIVSEATTILYVHANHAMH